MGEHMGMNHDFFYWLMALKKKESYKYNFARNKAIVWKCCTLLPDILILIFTKGLFDT